MAEERVYSLGTSGTTPAKEASLSQLGHQERKDLQQWILADPTLVESGLLVLTEEYAAWTSPDGAAVRDRLDVLALDQDGRTVVIELKRDDAPSDIHLQAITYAAMASRFTLADLVRIHRTFLEKKGSLADGLDVEAALRSHVADELTDDVLKSPRIVLVARRFPAQVTASAVWLNEMGIDVKLVQIRVWNTANDTVLTSSVVYPVPGAEEFIVEPDRQRSAEVKKEVTERTRARRTVTRILEAGLLQEGDVVRVNEYTELPVDVRAGVMDWLAEDPQRPLTTWVVNGSKPLRWAVDGVQYAPSTLIRKIVWEATGFEVKALYGTKWWADEQGRDLVELADLAGDG